MKKIFRVMIAAMLMAVMAVSLCSCGIPSDPEKAKANLEKNGYAIDTTVSTTTVKTFLQQNTACLSVIRLIPLF